jgi:hypothetical protein
VQVLGAGLHCEWQPCSILKSYPKAISESFQRLEEHSMLVIASSSLFVPTGCSPLPAHASFRMKLQTRHAPDRHRLVLAAQSTKRALRLTEDFPDNIQLDNNVEAIFTRAGSDEADHPRSSVVCESEPRSFDVY